MNNSKGLSLLATVLVSGLVAVGVFLGLYEPQTPAPAPAGTPSKLGATITESGAKIAYSSLQSGTTTACSLENSSGVDRMILRPFFGLDTETGVVATSSPDGFLVQAATSSHAFGIFNSAEYANATNTNYIFDYNIKATTTPDRGFIVSSTTPLDGATARPRLVWRTGDFINFVTSGTVSTSAVGGCGVEYVPLNTAI